MNELPYEFAWHIWAGSVVRYRADAARRKVIGKLSGSPLAEMIGAINGVKVAQAGMQWIYQQAQEKPWLRLMK